MNQPDFFNSVNAIYIMALLLAIGFLLAYIASKLSNNPKDK